MARDFRHGHGQNNKKQFQRKSQSKPTGGNSSKSSVPMIWAGGFFVSAILLVGFFVTQHFVTQGAKSEDPAETSIFKVAQEVKQQAKEAVAVVKEAAKPQPVVVEAVNVEPESTSSEPEKTYYSFYEGLGQMEVVVDAVPLSVELERPYYIQAGTFGSERVAKVEQKRLAKLGQELEMSVLTTKIRSYYRLRVGPFSDRLVLNKRRNELRKLGVDTLVVKAPKIVQ